MPRSFTASRPSAHRQSVLSGRALAMRHEPTPSEARLFEALRGGRLGVTFRRQAPLLGRFIADLVAPAVKLVVEVDGGYHSASVAHDARRDRALAGAGYTVLHLDAALIMSDLSAAVALVTRAIDSLR